jgi:hypothetical protein
VRPSGCRLGPSTRGACTSRRTSCERPSRGRKPPSSRSGAFPVSAAKASAAAALVAAAAVPGGGAADKAAAVAGAPMAPRALAEALAFTLHGPAGALAVRGPCQKTRALLRACLAPLCAHTPGRVLAAATRALTGALGGAVAARLPAAAGLQVHDAAVEAAAARAAAPPKAPGRLQAVAAAPPPQGPQPVVEGGAGGGGVGGPSAEASSVHC